MNVFDQDAPNEPWPDYGRLLKRRERLSRLPSVALLVGVAVLCSGLTATVMTVSAKDDNRPPPATRASLTTTGETSPPRAAPAAPIAPAPAGPAAPSSPAKAIAALPPVGVGIKAIKVLAEVDPMGLTANGQLQVPTNFARVGWWSGGPKPGEVGPAVLEGHVDSTKGAAVFYALRLLKHGDEIQVAREDRSNVVFVVDRLASYPKNNFPTHAVYGPTDKPTLRLITCTGSFDTSRRSYRDNLVVYAHLKA